MSRGIDPLRIVSALSGNWDNTVTSIQSILELIKTKSKGDVPSEALLFCDRTEKRKIEEKVTLGELKEVIERMGLEVEIAEVPTLNDILEDGVFPYHPRDGDIINTRPGSGLYPALMMNSVAGSLQQNESIVFYLAEVSPKGASMTWSMKTWPALLVSISPSAAATRETLLC